MRYLQLTALTLLCTVVVSMCLRISEVPPPRPASRFLPADLERPLLDPRKGVSEPAFHVPDRPPEPVPARDLPPALDELRQLELRARSMLLY